MKDSQQSLMSNRSTIDLSQYSRKTSIQIPEVDILQKHSIMKQRCSLLFDNLGQFKQINRNNDNTNKANTQDIYQPITTTENKENSISFQSFYQLNNGVDISDVNLNIENALKDIDQTYDSLYDTLQRLVTLSDSNMSEYNDSVESRLKQIKRLKQQMLKEIRLFRWDTSQKWTTLDTINAQFSNIKLSLQQKFKDVMQQQQ